MKQQIADYELAYDEISQALLRNGESQAFWDECDEVQERLIDQYPEDETAIIEMIVTWLVQLGVRPEGDLLGFI